MVAALGWGALSASSLVIGAVLGLARPWPRKLIGLVLGFGAGALISAVSFELFGEGVRLAGALPVAVGLAVGALLDGIPEQAVLGIGIAGGGSVSPTLLLAIFVSNLPEAIGSANDLRKAGRILSSRRV